MLDGECLHLCGHTGLLSGRERNWPLKVGTVYPGYPEGSSVMAQGLGCSSDDLGGSVSVIPKDGAQL